MNRRKMLIWKHLMSRKKGILVKILFVMMALALAGGWILADATSKAFLPPEFHQNLQHFRRNRSLKHYLDAIQVLIEPSSTACDKQNNVSLLVVVTSSPLRFDHRQAIRNTWAKHVPTYFFMGLNGATIEDLLAYIFTRNMHNLVTSCYRLRKVQQSFMGLGVRFCNEIPISIRELPLEKFKKSVKAQLVSKGYYMTIVEYPNDKDAWKYTAPQPVPLKLHK